LAAQPRAQPLRGRAQEIDADEEAQELPAVDQEGRVGWAHAPARLWLLPVLRIDRARLGVLQDLLEVQDRLVGRRGILATSRKDHEQVRLGELLVRREEPDE